MFVIVPFLFCLNEFDVVTIWAGYPADLTYDTTIKESWHIGRWVFESGFVKKKIIPDFPGGVGKNIVGTNSGLKCVFESAPYLSLIFQTF